MTIKTNKILFLFLFILLVVSSGFFYGTVSATTEACWNEWRNERPYYGIECYDMVMFDCDCGSDIASCEAGEYEDPGNAPCGAKEICTCTPGGGGGGGEIDGICASTHYGCDDGNSINNAENSSSWTWTCEGIDGGSNASCSEAKPNPAVNGDCSDTHYSCDAGNSASNNDNENSGSWTWMCLGYDGGSDASCSENQPSYTLSIPTAGTGSGTAGPAGAYFSGKVVTLTATPASNSIFSGWTGDSDCADGSVTMNSDKSCTATFSLMTGTLTSSASSCVIAGGASNCNVNLTWTTTNPVATSAVTSNTTNTGASGSTTLATGNSGGPTSSIVHYSGRNFYLYNNAILLDQKTVTSSCASGTAWNGSTCAQYTVSASAGVGGAISPSSRTVAHGETTTFTVTPSSGFTASVGGTCGGTLDGI